MTRIFSSCRHVPGFAMAAAAGFALAACAGPVADSPFRYTENTWPRVMSDAVPTHHAARSLSNDTRVADT